MNREEFAAAFDDFRELGQEIHEKIKDNLGLVSFIEHHRDDEVVVNIAYNVEDLEDYIPDANFPLKEPDVRRFLIGLYEAGYMVVKQEDMPF